MPHDTTRIAFVLSLVAACSSGGAGTVIGDGGRPDPSAASDAGSPDDSTVGPGPSANDAGSRADAKKPSAGSYPVTCEGLCAKADAKLPEGCDTTKCVSLCSVLEQTAANAAAGGCDAEWATYLDCAVLGGTMTACAYNGRLTLAGCSDEEQALTACVSKPKVCPRICTTDQECQLQCPAAPFSGVNCCDTPTRTCYATSGPTCG